LNWLLLPPPGVFSENGVIVYYDFDILLPRNHDIFWELNSRSYRGGDIEFRGEKYRMESRIFKLSGLGAGRRALMKILQM
jgi:hypothetical protein